VWMQIESCGGYKIRGLQEQRHDGWRITTWPEGRNKPEKHYWVKDGVFYKAGLHIAASQTEWQKASLGPVDNAVPDEEKAAVLKLIGKWSPDITQRSACGGGAQ
jgi:hypothetical protein